MGGHQPPYPVWVGRQPGGWALRSKLAAEANVIGHAGDRCQSLILPAVCCGWAAEAYHACNGKIVSAVASCASKHSRQ